MKPRIAISTSVIQRGKGGVGQYTLALARALKDHTDQLNLSLFVLQEDLPLFEFAREYAELIPVEERYRSPIKDILWHQTQLPKACATHGIDVLHVPSYRRMIASPRLPKVATIHDVAPFAMADKYEWKRMIYGRYVAKYLAHRQQKIVAVSQYTADELVRYFKLPKSRIDVALNGIDHARFFPMDRGDVRAEAESEEMRSRLQLPRPYFLYIARLEHPAKNHCRLLEAYDAYRKAHPDGPDLVFGGSDWHGAETIHQRMSQSPFRESIHNLGFVDDADVPRLYRHSRALIFPSLFEGFGLPPLEAMACGVPVASSPRGALQEVVGDAGWIFDPEDPSSIAEALHSMDSDPQERERLIVAGLRRAADYRWELTAEKMSAIYLEVFARSKKS